jgi:hypothetical protein
MPGSSGSGAAAARRRAEFALGAVRGGGGGGAASGCQLVCHSTAIHSDLPSNTGRREVP